MDYREFLRSLKRSKFKWHIIRGRIRTIACGHCPIIAVLRDLGGPALKNSEWMRAAKLLKFNPDRGLRVVKAADSPYCCRKTRKDLLLATALKRKSRIKSGEAQRKRKANRRRAS